MEEFVGFIPAGADQIDTLDYSIGACALGCADNKDYERVGCCSNAIEQWTCQECICYIENKKELEKYLEKRMNTRWHNYYKGLIVPPELTKETRKGVSFYSKEHGHTDCGILELCRGKKKSCLEKDQDGDYCIACEDCICNIEHKEKLEELIKMWGEEDNPIKPGMVVKYGKNNWCLVNKVEADRILGWMVGDNTTEAGSKLCELGNYVTVSLSNVDKVYKFRGDTMPHGEAIFNLTGNYTGWRRFWGDVELPVLELTVEDVEKKFGRKVKIVGEKK